MRKFFAAASALAGIALLAIGLANAQFNGCPGGFCSPAPASSFPTSCTESANWLARATAVTLTADKTNYDNLICGTVTDGTFSLFDGLYIFAAPTQATALLNLVQNAFPGTAHGTVSFSAYHGFTGNGTDFYIDTGFNPTTASSPKFTQNSAMIGAYTLTSRTTSQPYSMLAVADSFNTRILPYFTGGPLFYSVNGTTLQGVTSGNAQGSYLALRNDSTHVSIYVDGTLADGPSSNISAPPENFTFIIFGVNQTGSPGNLDADQMAAAWWGSTPNATQAANIQARINTFMTAYGINVY